MIRLLWVLPAIAVAGLVDTSFRMGFFVPVPILLVTGGVGVAAVLGGLRSGLIAAIIVVMFFTSWNMQQFGPPGLTGGIPQTALGSVLVLFLGFFLGTLRDPYGACESSET